MRVIYKKITIDLMNLINYVLLIAIFDMGISFSRKKNKNLTERATK